MSGATQRPWTVAYEVANQCLDLFPRWLRDRGGIVVYQNQAFDSSHFGEVSFMPLRFVAEEDGKLHDAPEWRGDLPSQRQQRVDTITPEQYGGDVERAIREAFKFETTPPPSKAVKPKKTSKTIKKPKKES